MKLNKRPPHRRRLATACAALAAPAMLLAQVSLYQFSESNQPYVEITGSQAAYSLGEPTYWPPQHNLIAWVNNEYFGAAGQVTNGGYLSGVYGPGYPIGFNFTYNGDVFDRIGVSHNGWISFGKSSDGLQAVWAYAGDHSHAAPFVQFYGGPTVAYKRNRVAGFGSSQLRMQDQSSLLPPGPVSSLLIATIGTAPNRTCVVQFKDFRASYSSSTTLINFQIRLNEADNSVEVRYGDVVFGYQAGGSVQVGLGGRIPEDFNSRRTVYEQPAFLYDWNATASGIENTDACLAVTEEPFHPNGSGVPPVSGLNWKWTPDACPPPTWPLTIADISFDSGHAIWEANSAGEYEYFLSTDSTVTGTEVASGTTTDPEAYFFGLEASTNYYVFVRSICNGEPGAWSLATPFQTWGGGVVVCDGGVVTENYCSQQHSTKEWLYAAADGSRLKIEFLGGYVGSSGTESFKVWDATWADPNADTYTGSGNLTGAEFTALSGTMYIRLITDAGACQAQDWYLPLDWRIGCKNCQDPLVNFNVGEVDCDNQQYYVDVQVFSMGSATSLEVNNDLGVAPATITGTNTFSVGPFPAGETVNLIAQNPDNAMCYSPSAPLVNEPCAITDCGPTWYEKCASQSETREWLLQGDGQPISVRFLPASLGFDAKVFVYDGADEMAPATTVTVSGQTNNQVVTSTNAEHKLLVRYQSTVYSDLACSGGYTQPMKFVAQCASNCEQPQATFSTECVTPSTFNVKVNVTSLGGNSSVQLTNSGSASSYSVNAVGEYVVGPFPNLELVRVHVEGADAICTWSSGLMSRDCLTMGVGEQAQGQLAAWPNPTNGHLQVQLPATLGQAQLMVQDLSGRTVVTAQAAGTQTTELDLADLPNGLYLLVAQGNNNRYITKISVQH